MATAVAPVTALHTRGQYDRVFYISVALGMALIVLVGFGPTYYMEEVYGRRMIRGLFEAHLDVVDLDRSLHFYTTVLGLDVALQRDSVDSTRGDAHSRGARRFAFLWVGAPGRAMLGLWERLPERVVPQHCAFEVGLDELLKLVLVLEERSVEFRDFFQQRTTVPTVFGFIPAASIYFDDPDGHVLELLAPLDAPPRPDAGVLSWPDWTRLVRGER